MLLLTTPCDLLSSEITDRNLGQWGHSVHCYRGPYWYLDCSVYQHNTDPAAKQECNSACRNVHAWSLALHIYMYPGTTSTSWQGNCIRSIYIYILYIVKWCLLYELKDLSGNFIYEVYIDRLTKLCATILNIIQVLSLCICGLFNSFHIYQTLDLLMCDQIIKIIFPPMKYWVTIYKVNRNLRSH